MLKMFEDAEAGKTIERPRRKVNDEYDVIMNNILMMFLNNTYLNIQLKEKQYRQQNAELTALQLQINRTFCTTPCRRWIWRPASSMMTGASAPWWGMCQIF